MSHQFPAILDVPGQGDALSSWLEADRAHRSAVVPLGGDADEPVQLMCRDGFVVPAIMRTSALGYHDNAIALVIFKDDLERVWSSGRTVI